MHRVARRTRNLLLEYTHDPRVAAPEIGDALAGSGGQDDPRHADVSFFWRIYARRPGSRAYLPVCCSEGPADGIEWKTAFAWTMKSSLVRKSVSLSMTISAWALASLRGKVPEQGEVLAEEGAYSEPRRDEEEKRVGLSERAEGELRVLLVSRWCSLAHPQPQPLQLVVAIAASISPFRSALSAGQWQWRTRIRTGSGETDARRRRVHGDVGMRRRRTESGAGSAEVHPPRWEAAAKFEGTWVESGVRSLARSLALTSTGSRAAKASKWSSRGDSRRCAGDDEGSGVLEGGEARWRAAEGCKAAAGKGEGAGAAASVKRR